MGLVAKLLSFTRLTRNSAEVSDVKVDRGGGDTRTLEHFSAPGDDSHPLPGDYVAALSQAGTGREAAVGYLDPLNNPKAGPGEKRIKARDASTGLDVVDVWLKSDGTAITENANGSSTLAPDGSITGTNNNGSFSLQSGGAFVVNGVTISPNGDVDIPSSLTVNSKEIADHGHDINSGSSAPGPTGGNN